MNHEEGRPESKLGPPGAEDRVQVLPHQVADERVGQDPLELGADLDPHGPGGGVVEHEQAAAAGLPAHAQLAHGGEGELLGREAARVGGEDDPNVDAGLVLYPLEILVVLPLVPGRDQVNPVVDPPRWGSERGPEHHEQQGVGGEHQQEDRAAECHGGCSNVEPSGRERYRRPGRVGGISPSDHLAFFSPRKHGRRGNPRRTTGGEQHTHIVLAVLHVFRVSVVKAFSARDLRPTT